MNEVNDVKKEIYSLLDTCTNHIIAFEVRDDLRYLSQYVANPSIDFLKGLANKLKQHQPKGLTPMNMDNLKTLIDNNVEWRLVDSHYTNKLMYLILCVNVEGEDIEVSFTLKVKDNGIQTDVEITRCDDVIIVEGNDVFSKNDEELENSIYDWLKTQVQYGKDEVISYNALGDEDEEEDEEEEEIEE